ncbi:MAG: hypothetical protein ACUZ8E_03095 [Candidatus Anammoxibacter sp.]
MKWKERHRLLKFFYDANFNDNVQSAYREDEVDHQLKPSMNRKKLKIYLIEFIENKWIEQDKRPNAYKITNKGIVHVGYNKFRNNYISDRLRNLKFWILLIAASFAILFYGEGIFRWVYHLLGCQACN